MLTNVKNPLLHNGEQNKKVIWNPHADPNHHQKLTTSRKSPLGHVGQVWSTSVSTFISYPVYSMTRQNDHTTSALLGEVIKIEHYAADSLTANLARLQL